MLTPIHASAIAMQHTCGVVCGGLQSSAVWSAVVCSGLRCGLWWSAVVCGGLRFSDLPLTGYGYFLHHALLCGASCGGLRWSAVFRPTAYG